MDFILATNNMKKLAEMQRILSPLGINVVTAKMLGVTLEDVEEDVLRTRLSGQLLDVVDDQHVDHLVEVDEIGDFAVLVGRLELRLKLVHRDVQHLQLRMALPHLVADGLHDVGFA